MTNQTTEEKREVDPNYNYIGSDEVWPLPWQLSPDQLELRDANGYTVIKAWNGHANILYAYKAVNAHAALEAENKALKILLRSTAAKFRACAIHSGSHPEFVDAGLADVYAALGESK